MMLNCLWWCLITCSSRRSGTFPV